MIRRARADTLRGLRRAGTRCPAPHFTASTCMTSPYPPARQARSPLGPIRTSRSRGARSGWRAVVAVAFGVSHLQSELIHPTGSGCRVTTQHDANVTPGVQQKAFSGLLQKELVRRRPPEASSSRVWRESNHGFGIRRSNEAVRLPSTNRGCGAVPCAPPSPHRRHPGQRQQPPEATPSAPAAFHLEPAGRGSRRTTAGAAVD